MHELLDLLLLSDLRDNHDRRMVEAAIRRHCNPVPVDAETILCRVLGRYKFYVDSRDTSLAPHLLLDGFWEYWITDVMLRNVAPGDTVYDVGANLGYYSVLMAELAGPEGRLLAFEPNPRMAQLLQRNLEINGFTGRSLVDQRATSQRSGEQLTFHASTEHPKNGSLMHASGPDAGRLQVTTVALDDFSDRPADFIKIDVEGAEAMVWAGMQRLLDASPKVKILMEFNAGRGSEAAALLDSIAARYPLREVCEDAIIRPVERSALLARPLDTMLYLSHQEPNCRPG